MKFSLKNMILLWHSSLHFPTSPVSPKKTAALDDIPFCNSTDPSYYGTNMDPSNSRRFGNSIIYKIANNLKIIKLYYLYIFCYNF